MIDLSALDQVSIEPGKPLLLDINLVIEDPEQPRQEFDEKALQELADDIRERGVKSPVSVKPINNDGFYILNAGARRRRAVIIAGLSKIPAFIDHDFTDYDQVNENEQRENLSLMELALFVKKKLDKGDKAVDIAQKLRKSKTDISFLKALTDLPECLSLIMRSGRCTSPRHLYDLKNLYESAPKAVSDYIETSEEITSRGIAELKLTIFPSEVKSTVEEPAAPNLQSPGSESPDNRPEGKENSEGAGKDQKNVQPENPNKIKKPILFVKHNKRTAILLLDRKPKKKGFVFIRYEDGDQKKSVVEAPVEALKIERLVDSSKNDFHLKNK
jgi:ParB family transcriptional regulator, chromosome partitioning protein